MCILVWTPVGHRNLVSCDEFVLNLAHDLYNKYSAVLYALTTLWISYSTTYSWVFHKHKRSTTAKRSILKTHLFLSKFIEKNDKKTCFLYLHWSHSTFSVLTKIAKQEFPFPFIIRAGFRGVGGSGALRLLSPYFRDSSPWQLKGSPLWTILRYPFLADGP